MQAIWERSNLIDEGDDNFIQSKMLNAQDLHKKRVEGNNYDTRKPEYDGSVMRTT